MNKAKKVAWRKHRIMQKKLKLKRKQEAEAAGRTPS